MQSLEQDSQITVRLRRWLSPAQSEGGAPTLALRRPHIHPGCRHYTQDESPTQRTNAGSLNQTAEAVGPSAANSQHDAQLDAAEAEAASLAESVDQFEVRCADSSGVTVTDTVAMLCDSRWTTLRSLLMWRLSLTPVRW